VSGLDVVAVEIDTYRVKPWSAISFRYAQMRAMVTQEIFFSLVP
jgi:hypothetical protein